jgi:hypothetical protein
MLSDEQIENAKKQTLYSLNYPPLHYHNDCIRIAYQWLDAQKKIKNPTTRGYDIKHLIENWAGCYVSQADVDVAALIHPEINGTYPYFNISARLTEPSVERLKGISEAFKESAMRGCHNQAVYKVHES